MLWPLSSREGGVGKALVAGPLKKIPFFAALPSKPIDMMRSTSTVHNDKSVNALKKSSFAFISCGCGYLVGFRIWILCRSRIQLCNSPTQSDNTNYFRIADISVKFTNTIYLLKVQPLNIRSFFEARLARVRFFLVFRTTTFVSKSSSVITMP